MTQTCVSRSVQRAPDALHASAATHAPETAAPPSAGNVGRSPNALRNLLGVSWSTRTVIAQVNGGAAARGTRWRVQCSACGEIVERRPTEIHERQRCYCQTGWRTPRRKVEVAADYTPGEDIYLRREVERGRSIASIADDMERRPEALARRARNLGLEIPASVTQERTTPRTCLGPLCCGQRTFASRGIGHRICDGCRSAMAGVAE